MKRTLSAAALCVLAVLAVPTAANAAGYGPGSCSSIAPTSVAQGASVTYSCDDFWQPNEPVSITISGASADALTASTGTKAISVTATDNGSLELSVKTGASSLGTYTLTATQGSITDSSDFTVVAASGSATGTSTTSDGDPAAAAATASDNGSGLASTGFQGAALPWIGGGLLAAGIAALVVVLARRRKQA